MPSLLRKHPWLFSLFGTHAALFMADPCSGGDGDSAPATPPPIATVAPAPPPPAPSWSVYQKRGPGEPVVDVGVLGGENVDASICNDGWGDVLLGAGWSIADATVSLRELTISRDTGGVTNAAALYVHAGAAGARSFRAWSTCLHGDKLMASVDVGITTTAQAPATAPAGKSATAVSSCVAGLWLVGGGFDVEAPVDGGQRVYPRVTKVGPQDNAWVMRARGKTGTTTFATTAVCAQTRTEILYPYPTKTFAVDAGTTARDTLGCPDGYSVYSGGFAFDDDALVTAIENRPAPDLAAGATKGPVTQWLVAAKNDDTVRRDVRMTVLCGRTSDAAKKAPVFTPPSPDSPAPDPKLVVTPNPITAYCANASWPNKLTVKNDGGGNLAWNVTPPGGTPNLQATPSSGVLAAGASETVTLGGQVAGVASFDLAFASNGGASNVTVQCQ